MPDERTRKIGRYEDSRSIDPIEQSFLDALERLQRGEPINKDLRSRVKMGKLKIGPTSVALEAGHSRTLIGHVDCQYPKVRERLLALRRAPEIPNSLRDVVATLRKDKSLLAFDLQNARTQYAVLRVRVMHLELELERRNREIERLRKSGRVQSIGKN